MQRSLHNDDGPVHNQPEVDGTEAHQVGAHPEYPHHAKREKHGQRDGGCYNQACPQVTKEKHQHEDHDQCPLNQVLFHRTDGPPDQFSTVQVGFDHNILGQRLLDHRDFLLDPPDHLVAVLSFEHHHHPANGVDFPVIG